MDGVANVAKEGFLLLASVGGPLIGGLLVVGLVIGILQSTTQINDPAIGFLPRMAAALIGAWTLGGWVMERCARYLATSIGRIGPL
jgi:flagellar biosynthesis protein FliQ